MQLCIGNQLREFHVEAGGVAIGIDESEGRSIERRADAEQQPHLVRSRDPRPELVGDPAGGQLVGGLGLLLRDRLEAIDARVASAAKVMRLTSVVARAWRAPSTMPEVTSLTVLPIFTTAAWARSRSPPRCPNCGCASTAICAGTIRCTGTPRPTAPASGP